MILIDQIRREVSDALAQAFLPLEELVAAIDKAGVTPAAARPGWAFSRPQIVIRHPLDPEFAEVRQVDVILVGSEAGWRIHEVRGLPAA
jgi:hypothetical protein